MIFKINPPNTGAAQRATNNNQNQTEPTFKTQVEPPKPPDVRRDKLFESQFSANLQRYQTTQKFEAAPFRTQVVAAELKDLPKGTLPPNWANGNFSLEELKQYTQEINGKPEQLDTMEEAVIVWQRYADQWGAAGKGAVADKVAKIVAGTELPDKVAQEIVRRGGEPPYIGGWSNAPGKSHVPVFVQDFPSAANRQLQIYAFPNEVPPTASTEWRVFEITGDILKAYNDDTFTGNKKGTNSFLGFPQSGHEFLDKGENMPFANDPVVQNELAQHGRVGFQSFDNGYLVEIGGTVQAFGHDGKRVGTPYPNGSIEAVRTPGVTSPNAEWAGIFEKFDVAPNLSITSRLGMHWGLSTDYSTTDPAKIDAVINLMKESGVGYSTVIVNADNVEGMRQVITKLKAAGIEPIVRLLPGGDYNKTLDKLTPADMDQMARAAKQLQDMGVRGIQLDNEFNNREGEKSFINEFKNGNKDAVIQKYVDNLAETMRRINQQAPEVAVGFGSLGGNYKLNDGKDIPDSEFASLTSEMFKMTMEKLADKTKSSEYSNILNRAFIATHSYNSGGNPNGLKETQNFVDMANQIFKQKGLPGNLKGLSTEGGARGHGVSENNPTGVTLGDLKQVSNNRDYTLGLWYAVGEFLGDARGDFTNDELILPDGKGGYQLSQFMKEWIQIVRGERKE